MIEIIGLLFQNSIQKSEIKKLYSWASQNKLANSNFMEISGKTGNNFYSETVKIRKIERQNITVVW